MKKWIVLSLALIMALSLCACGKDTGGKKDDENRDEKVNASLFTEVLMSEKNSDGGTDTMKGIIEYDDEYNIIGTKTYTNDKLVYEVIYDKDPDKPLLNKSYDEDGNCTDKTEYTYDADGNCLECTSTYEYDGQTVTSKHVNTYDANRNILTEKSYKNGKLNYECHYTYTADGNMEKQTYFEDGVESAVYTYTYDEQGNVLTEKLDGPLSGYVNTYENTYENGKLVEVKAYEDGVMFRMTKYDSEGNEILDISYDQDSGEEWTRMESAYENGKLIKEVEYYEGEEQCVSFYSYNAAGKLTERSYTYTGSDPQRRVYTYNENGDLVGLKAYMGDEMISEYTMTYESVSVSEEVAKRIQETNAFLETF